MKKYVLISLLALVAMCFTACEDRGPRVQRESVYMTVEQNEWKWDNEAEQFYAHFNVPEITANVYNYGNYCLYREYNTGTKDAYQVGLPQSLYLWENVQDSTGADVTIYYQQLVDYRVGVGYVEIQVTNNDFFYAEDEQGYLINPEKMVFHLQLMY